MDEGGLLRNTLLVAKWTLTFINTLGAFQTPFYVLEIIDTAKYISGLIMKEDLHFSVNIKHSSNGLLPIELSRCTIILLLYYIEQTFQIMRQVLWCTCSDVESTALWH